MQIRKGYARTLTAHPHTALGTVGRVENAIWQSSDPTVVEVTQNPDNPIQAKAVAVGEGVAIVRFDADGHLGDGVLAIFAEIEIHAIPEDSVAVDIEAGDEEPA